LLLSWKILNLTTLVREIIARKGSQGGFRSGIRRRAGVRGRRLFCQVAAKGMMYSRAEVARLLGVTGSSVNRLAVLEELPEFRGCLNAL